MRQVFLVFIFCFSVTLSPVLAADKTPADIEELHKLGGQAFDIGEYEKAYEVWLPLAEAGHAPAQFGLSLLHGQGWGVEQNLDNEFNWLLKAAEGNYAKAQYNLSLRYGRTFSEYRDWEKGMFWLFVSAENGLGEAQSLLSNILSELDSVSADYDNQEDVQDKLQDIKERALEWLQNNHS